MSSAETVIKSLLEADSAVGALVSSRIYGSARPESDALPALVFEEISDVTRESSLNSAGADLMAARIQVTCISAGRAQLKSLKAAVWAACHKKSGTFSGTVAQSVVGSAGPSSYDPETQIYEQHLDFSVMYQ